MWNKRIIYFSFLLSIILFSVSCKTKKEVIKNTKWTNSENLSHVDSVFKRVEANEFVFENFKAKISTYFKNNKGEKHSFTTLLQIQKDSAIWAKMSAFGIQVASIYITPDSVVILDKIKKKYASYDFSYIKNKIGTELKFNDIQSLLVGNRMEIDSSKNYSVYKEDDFLQLSELNKADTNDLKFNRWEVEYFVNDFFKIFVTSIDNRQKSSSIHIQNMDYNSFKNHTFPKKIFFDFASPKDTVNISLNYRKIKTEKNRTFNFTIPEHYTKQ